jgi:hypothetical protein
MRGDRSLTPRTSAPNSSSTGSTICEWKACEVRRRRHDTPALAS